MSENENDNLMVLKWYSIVWIGLVTLEALLQVFQMEIPFVRNLVTSHTALEALFQMVQVDYSFAWSLLLILPVNLYLWGITVKGVLKWYSIIVVAFITLIGLLLMVASVGTSFGGFAASVTSFIIFVPVNIYLWMR